MIPLICPSYLGEYYQLLARGHKVFSCGIPVTTIDAAYLFSIITRELTIPVEQWRGVLMHLGIPLPHNFFHTYDIYHELVKLCQRGDLRLVKIPRLERLPAIATGYGWGYCFIRGPQSHPQDHSPISFNSVQEAQNFVSSLNVGEKELRLCTHRNPMLAALLDRETDFNQRFIECLANKEILAYKVRVGNSAPAVKPLEYMPATAVDREVPLGPETTPGSAIKSTLNSRKGIPPSSLDNAVNRLGSMNQEIAANGHIPKYTDEQLLQQAQQGDVANERYHVRFMEVGYQWDRNDALKDSNNLTGKLGREFTGETGTGPRYWSTTFDQIEDADTDSKLICEKLGIDYDPSKQYVMAIIDTEKAKPLTDCECVAATFGNISAFANRELPSDFPKEFTDLVMNAEYQAQYKAHYREARKKFLESDWSTNKDDFSDYLSTTDLTESQKELMIQRMNMHSKIGNNQHYLGNGVTENKIAKSSNKFGVVETHNFERTPMNLQRLKEEDAINIIYL
jgi:hypothetical protein